jgi:hypothetical protein
MTYKKKTSQSQSGFTRAQAVPQSNNGMLGSIQPSAGKSMTLVTAPEKATPERSYQNRHYRFQGFDKASTAN